VLQSRLWSKLNMDSTTLDLHQAIATGKYAIPYNLNEV